MPDIRRRAALAACALVAVACTEAPPATAPSASEGPSVAPTVAAAPADEALGPARLTMWARGGLPEDVPARATDVPGVVHAAASRQATVGLTGSRAADGTVVDDLDPGWRIPVSGAAIDPPDWAALLDDEAVADRVRSLRPGGVLLSATFAGGRGLGTGAVVDLDGRSGLDVLGVVPDGTVGDAEIILHEGDAQDAGITRGPTLVVTHAAPDADGRAQLTQLLAALVADEVDARIVDARDPTVRPDAPLVLPLHAIKETFGEFAYRPRASGREVDADPLWEMANIVRAEVPLLGTVRCHRGIIDDLVAALDEVVATGLGPTIDPDAYAGCWYPRLISPDGPNLSSHSWGISLDINVDLDLPGLGPPPDPEVVAIFGRHGFRWGGDFLVPDNHHFEWVGGSVTPAPPSTDDS